jgi:hypothetical protein
MRRSDDFLAVAALATFLVGLTVVEAALHRGEDAGWAAERAMVRRLGLTDLCLFTEARYTRHPSQADHFAPFQDHPQALEHFPSGSILAPPVPPPPGPGEAP